MAHEVYEIEGEDSMAFVNETPWHGLGQELLPNAPLEVWAKKAHLDWNIDEAVAGYFDRDTAEMQVIPNRKVLLRGDNKSYLSTVSLNYNVTQPDEVLEFFRELIKSGGFEMETAGSLFNGKRIWALAKINESARIMGQDEINGYLLLATSCDGSLSNTGQFTSIRVVCNNTLEWSINEDNRSVRMPHNTEFDPEKMREELGLGHNSFGVFIKSAEEMAKKKVSKKDAVSFFVDLYSTGEEDEDLVKIADTKHVGNLIKLFEDGPGSDFKSSKSTVWGLINAVTRYYDHECTSKNSEYRLNKAWFGKGARFKNKAWDLAKAA
jgi:phage/plasmid-like protein (TIGR03299 family)